MTTKRNVPRVPPGMPSQLNPGPPPNPMAQGISLAMFSAAQDNCNCRACQVLKKVLSEMTEQYLQGGGE